MECLLGENKTQRGRMERHERVGFAQLLAKWIVHVFGEREFARSQNLKRNRKKKRQVPIAFRSPSGWNRCRRPSISRYYYIYTTHHSQNVLAHTTITITDHCLDVPIKWQVCRHLYRSKKNERAIPKAYLPTGLSPSRSFSRNRGGKWLAGTCRAVPASEDHSQASPP